MKHTKRVIALVILLATNGFLFSQDYPQEFYIEHNPSVDLAGIKLDPLDTGKVDRILYREMIIEFRYDENWELMEFRTDRWKLKLESDLGIEDYNKIYINLNNAL